jgi:hypothetical protein
LVPNIAQRIHYVIAVVILLSISPAIISILRARRQLSVINANRAASLPQAEKE